VVKETVAFVIPANPGSGSRAGAGIQRISSSTLLTTVVWLITVSRLLAMFQLNELYELYEPNKPNRLPALDCLFTHHLLLFVDSRLQTFFLLITHHCFQAPDSRLPTLDWFYVTHHDLGVCVPGVPNKWIYQGVPVYHYTLREVVDCVGLLYSTIRMIAKRVHEMMKSKE